MYLDESVFVCECASYGNIFRRHHFSVHNWRP